MALWQLPKLLSMMALGTNGGHQLADGSLMPAGVHLRWDFDGELGFPTGGFDVFRREHIPGTEWCAGFYPLDGRIILRGSDNGPKYVLRDHREGLRRAFGRGLRGKPHQRRRHRTKECKEGRPRLGEATCRRGK